MGQICVSSDVRIGNISAAMSLLKPLNFINSRRNFVESLCK